MQNYGGAYFIWNCSDTDCVQNYAGADFMQNCSGTDFTQGLGS